LQKVWHDTFGDILNQTPYQAKKDPTKKEIAKLLGVPYKKNHQPRGVIIGK
jgi:hypothetical protein